MLGHLARFLLVTIFACGPAIAQRATCTAGFNAADGVLTLEAVSAGSTKEGKFRVYVAASTAAGADEGPGNSHWAIVSALWSD
ncbi:MAG: hypothetical protein D4R84_02285 [Rhodocyclaceae bacterium]|nr:MAG: hypothetical protein D4R84_02285 [Rhodocyclaceae bacterium]